jgi:adenosylmethionine-8-amino-7-oxononanoate aminotransferase
MDLEGAREYPLLGRAAVPPLAISRAEGCFLFSADGRRILDAAGGAIVVNIGHGREEVAEVARRALLDATYVVPPFVTESRARLVSRLRKSWLPERLSRMVFTSGGSDAVDLALRIARQHFVSRGEMARWKVIGRELSYHGTTLATLSVGGHGKRKSGFEPLLVPHPKAPACYPLRCGLCRGGSGCSLACADAFEEVIIREGPETVAAVIAEPVVGSTAGAVVPPREYWPRLSEICRRYGVLLIADEVMTGFGRTGRRFAVEHWGVTPDLLVAGKGLSGGYAPIGAVFTTEEVVEPIAERGDELMFYTYSAHPGSCAIADKVLEILERENLVERAAALGRQLADRLAGLRSHPHVAETRGLGLLHAVELVCDSKTLEAFPPQSRVCTRVVAAGLRRGVFFYPGGGAPAPDVLCVGPPFVIEPDEIDFLVEVLEKSIGDALD